ncbi:TPA: hypothetical protein HA316_04710 [Candidatus Micrarchaeota archaeon]|nr:hypothetical protein [Candidatus Micrarchaeota archaeon]
MIVLTILEWCEAEEKRLMYRYADATINVQKRASLGGSLLTIRKVMKKMKLKKSI